MDKLIIADALIGVLAQRMIKKLCKDCKKSYTPSNEEWDNLANLFGDKEKFYQLKKEKNKDGILFRPGAPCEICKTKSVGGGYRGITGVYELLVCDEKIKSLITRGETSQKLQEAAIQKGMLLLNQHAIIKILQGVTDLHAVESIL